jgi:hypothetical protein
MVLQHKHTVDFDPDNKEHRQAYHAFSKRNAWGDSPLRFSRDPAYTNLITQVSDKLLKWYMTQEMK